MNKKLLVLDVEGTIFQALHPIDETEYASTMWQSLAHSLGEEGCRREFELEKKWESGKYKNYLEWIGETYTWIHKDLGLKKETFNRLIFEAEYIPGVKEFFHTLDRKIYIPVLISGGFQELVVRAQKDLKIEHGHGACEYFFDSEDGYLVSLSVTPCDFEGKYEYIKVLFSNYNLNPNTDWIFVGDGKNDLDIAKRAPISIAINGHEELKKAVRFKFDDNGNSINNFFQIKKIIDALTSEDFHKISQIKSDNISSPFHEENEYLKEENERLKIENKRLKQENNDLKGRQKKPRERKFQKKWLKEQPKRLLSVILKNTKTVFVGLKKEYEQFAFLQNIDKNLTVIPAGSENHSFKDYQNVDYLFVFKDCIGHKLAEKAINELKVPYIYLPPQRNKEILIQIMANALIAEFG